MKMKKITKCLVTSFALAFVVSTTLPEVQICAAERSANAVVETRYISGDGVRLREEGCEEGTILELMYKGERINYYPYILGSASEYNYMQRVKTGTYGYVDHHYASVYPQ